MGKWTVKEKVVRKIMIVFLAETSRYQFVNFVDWYVERSVHQLVLNLFIIARKDSLNLFITVFEGALPRHRRIVKKRFQKLRCGFCLTARMDAAFPVPRAVSLLWDISFRVNFTVIFQKIDNIVNILNKISNVVTISLNI